MNGSVKLFENDLVQANHVWKLLPSEKVGVDIRCAGRFCSRYCCFRRHNKQRYGKELVDIDNNRYWKWGLLSLRIVFIGLPDSEGEAIKYEERYMGGEISGKTNVNDCRSVCHNSTADTWWLIGSGSIFSRQDYILMF